MPQLDKTGPQGQGPMTGRGMGPCSNRPRRGFGLGRLSCCVRERFFSRKNEQASLEEEKKRLLALERERDAGDPLWAEVLYWQGDLRRRRGDYERADSLFVRALEIV